MALAHVEALAGQGDRARRYLRESHASIRRNMYLRAWLHLGLGERAAAPDALRAAVRAGEPGSVWMSIDAFLAPLRDDPRFRRLLDEAGQALPIAKAS